MSIYEKWRAGQSVTVRTLPLGNDPGGAVFQIVPVMQGLPFAIGYSLIADGQPVPSEQRKELLPDEARDWFALLEEVEA